MYIYINLIESFNGIISIKVELNFATNKAMLTHKWMHYLLYTICYWMRCRSHDRVGVAHLYALNLWIFLATFLS